MPASPAIPPEINVMLRRTFLDWPAPDCPRCSTCKTCGPARASDPLAWCPDCLAHGCTARGYFGMGPMGQALLFPHKLRRVQNEGKFQILQLDAIRFPCFARTVDGGAVSKLVNRNVIGWVEPDGVYRIHPVPPKVVREAHRAADWGV